MLSVPVYNAAGEKVAEESIDPADFGGEVNKQLLHDVVLMHLAAERVGTVNTRGPRRRRRLGQEAVPPEGDRQRPGRRQADQQAGRRRRRLRPPEPRLSLLDAQEGGPDRDPDGPPLEVPGWPGPDHRRPRPRREAQDQGRRPGPQGDPPARPHRGRGRRRRGRDQGDALRRTLDGRSILFGLPDQDPVFYRAPGTSKGSRSPRSPSSTPTTSSSNATWC